MRKTQKQSRQRRRFRDTLLRGLRIFMGLLLLLALFWVAGFLWFISSLPNAPAAPQQKADGIVALTGGAYRISLAVSLLEDKLGERLLISGIYEELDNETLRRANGIPRDIFACCIDLGRGAANTKGNADEAAIWAAAHGYKSLRIVTTFDHMPRSLVEFQRAMPEVTLIPHPVSKVTVGPQVRWPSFGRLALEYTKYWVALLRARAGTGTGVLKPAKEFT